MLGDCLKKYLGHHYYSFLSFRLAFSFCLVLSICFQFGTIQNEFACFTSVFHNFRLFNCYNRGGHVQITHQTDKD